MMGVKYNEFWELNPKTLEPFIEAFNLKNEYLDKILWENGVYIKLAIGSSLSKEIKYPTRPFGSKNKENTMENIKSKFLFNMELINSRFGE